MNELDKTQPKGLDSLFRPHKRCDVCEKIDDEDLYIIFNILYRVLVGDVFYQGSLKDNLGYDLEVLPEEKADQVTEESKSSEEKLRVFQQNMSREILYEIISSVQFDQLLREIFKSKYSRISETTCKHEELTKHFIKIFNVGDNKQLQSINDKREKTLQNKDRLDSLLAAISQLKDNVQKYHSEINKLSNHIISRLFNSQTNSQQRDKSPTQENQRLESNLETLRFKKSNPLAKTKRSGRANTNAYESTAPSSGPATSSNGNGTGNNSGSNQANESSSNGNSENSTDSTSNNTGENNKKRSKALPFKSKLPKKATDILKSWFLSNINSPYPSHEAKENLSKLTGLTKKQIQNWFTNSRKRFWEPSKKKVEVKQSGDVTPNDSMMMEQSFDTQSRQNIIEQPTLPQSNPEPLNPPQNPQPKPVLQFMPQFQNVVSPSMLKPISPVAPQRFIPQNQMQNQAVFYPGMMPQGVIPQGLMQNGSNIVIVPYYVPQPTMAYSYKMPEMMPMNGTFMQFPQGNMQMMEQQPSMMPTPGMGNSYYIPFQPNMPNMMDMRGNGQNFNTINNNVYNNINNLGTIGNMGPMGTAGPIAGHAGYNTMPIMPNMTNINPGFNPMAEKQQFMNRANPNDFQGGMGSPKNWAKNMNGGIHHMKPELDDMNHQGRKHLHKDLNPENNTN